jgi:hypothetical protein
MRAPRQLKESRLRVLPGTAEWEIVRARARLEVQRLRSLPRTDPLDQIRQGTWPNPTPEQIRQMGGDRWDVVGRQSQGR